MVTVTDQFSGADRPPAEYVPVRVSNAVAAAGWPGVALWRTRMSDHLVYPVVEVLPAAHERVRLGQGPQLHYPTVALWEEWPDWLDGAPPARAVGIVGVVTEAPWRRALDALDRLACFGAGLILRRSAPTALRSSEADLYGFGIVAVASDEADASVAVHGRPGPVPTASRTAEVRYREELLFERLLQQQSVDGAGDLTARRAGHDVLPGVGRDHEAGETRA